MLRGPLGKADVWINALISPIFSSPSPPRRPPLAFRFRNTTPHDLLPWTLLRPKHTFRIVWRPAPALAAPLHSRGRPDPLPRPAPPLAGGVSRAADASRVLFLEQRGPLDSLRPPRPPRTLRPENLADTMEIEIPLRIRDLPKLWDRVGRSEIVPLAEMERDYFPVATDYEAVRAWLVREGFTITGTDADRLAVFARGTIGQIQQSLQVQMGKVTVNGGADYYAAKIQPQLARRNRRAGARREWPAAVFAAA